MKNEIQLNIQPKAGILKIFSRLNYKQEYAIAEFVDNSTASYLGNKNKLISFGIKKVTIKIEYESNENVLTITDDAYGMDLNDFKRAIMMDQEPDHLNGRNEFGMGLKTAASWFGNVWSVKSTRLGHNEEYYAKIDINELDKNNINSITIQTRSCDEMLHGTTIKIWDITKKLSSSSKSKVKKLLSSIYRRDIDSNEIEIWYDGLKLESEKLECLKFKDRTWKEDLNFTFSFNNKQYHITGFVGILSLGEKEKGSFTKAGFALFRYNRMIIGGPDLNYKPKEIFGQAQSQISLRLFGELNMEDFQVNQAKDGFIWDDGLEEEFIKKLKLQIQDYIDIANTSVYQRISENEIADNKSDLVLSKVKDKFSDINLDTSIINNNQISLETLSPKLIEFQSDLVLDNKSGVEKRSKTREYSIHLSDQWEITFKVEWIIKNDDSFLFNYNQKNHEILINSNHSFFKKFIAKDEFKVLIECFILAFAYAQEEAELYGKRIDSNEKLISPSVFRNTFNRILEKLSEKREK